MARDDLFSTPPQPAATPPHAQGPAASAPLAARMRPRNLDEYAGQQHILAPGQLLRRAIEADRIQSLIFYGPPGTGKTSLAQLIALRTSNKFERLSGVESNVADMRRVLAAAANRLANTGQPTILFIDEIHRFNKSQQDALLPYAESGLVTFIGATTENPSCEVNLALLVHTRPAPPPAEILPLPVAPPPPPLERNSRIRLFAGAPEVTPAEPPVKPEQPA